MPTWDTTTTTWVNTNTIGYAGPAIQTIDIPIDSYFVTKDALKEFADKLYKIIEEHTKIDISEEEFMNIMKGE